ncbi:hypothetical protein ACA910_003960 [Epithemia clementina (nom. ined.)]
MSSSYLILASRRGITAEMLVELLARSEGEDGYHAVVDLNFSDSTGSTALHYASFYNNHPVVRVLLERGANVQAQDRWGESPLHVACARGSFESVTLLLQSGADANALDHFDKTPLLRLLVLWLPATAESRSLADGRIVAAAKNDYSNIPSKIVKVLVQHGVRLDLPAKDGTTVLHGACQMGSVPMVRCLLENGATVNVVDNKGETPLHYACKNGRLDIVQILLVYHADPNMPCTVLNRTPLHVACSHRGNVDCIQCLIAHGADHSALDKDGNPPIAVAANNLDMEVVQSMLCSVFFSSCLG